MCLKCIELDPKLSHFEKKFKCIYLSLSLSLSLSKEINNCFNEKCNVCMYWPSSRYDVRKSNKTENEVTVSEEATKVDRERSFDYNFEYNNKVSSLFLDVTQLVITYAGMIGFFFRFQ